MIKNAEIYIHTRLQGKTLADEYGRENELLNKKCAHLCAHFKSRHTTKQQCALIPTILAIGRRNSVGRVADS